MTSPLDACIPSRLPTQLSPRGLRSVHWRSYQTAMNRRSALKQLGGAALFAPAIGCATPANVPARTTVLSEALSPTTTPGLAALVIRNFHAEPELVAGACAFGSSDRVAPGQRWHLGSCGKAVTATLIARLVEAGVLDWERPLSEMLPAARDRMREAYRNVTLPDLLSHRSGLPENTSDLALFMSFYDDNASLPEQRLRYVTECLNEAPIVPARGARSYSNTGYLAAAACAEAATGRSFEDMVTNRIFHPLDMHSVSFVQFGGASEPQGNVDGRIADQPHDANPPMFAPAGGMRMTMRDWSRFCIDHLRGAHGHGRLLQPHSYQFLHAAQGETNSALGWGVAQHPLGLRGPALTHTGSDGNWYTAVILFPETGNGVLTAANAAESMGGRSRRHVRAASIGADSCSAGGAAMMQPTCRSWASSRPWA